MTLNRLCFLAEPNSSEYLKVNRNKSWNNIWRGARGAVRWFCGDRSLCRCAAIEERGHDSSRFEDIAGVDGCPNEKVGGGNPRIFSYSELYIATSGFSDKEVLGSGGFGRVYRGVLPSDGTAVAVKCVASHGDRFEKAFAAELVAVAQLRHRNLVRLRGWCVYDDRLLLVYDYMPNRSLDRILFSPSSCGPPLEWERRRRVVSGLAAALFYLHEQLDTQIIHRDVKTSNVMLDADYNARLGDFGLARWLEHGGGNGNGSNEPVEVHSMRSASAKADYQFRISETSRIGGTIGYLPPESFQRKGTATAKSDVFSFGIVVLEVATGRRAVDLTYPDDEIFMLDWVRRLSDEKNLLSAVDHKLADGTYPLVEMGRLLRLGLLCSLHDPRSRPTMKWVTENLFSSGDLPPLPSFKSHPQYISLSSSSSSSSSSSASSVPTTQVSTLSNSNYHTAAGSTIFFTADNVGNGSGGGGSNESRSSGSKPIPNVDTPRKIPYKEIVTITNNFSETQMVAELDFGTGYQGFLENRFHVLVKRLGMKTCPALRVRFANELDNLTRLRHRHLVQLRGWCTEQGEMLVVYDYSPSSLLSHYLFNRRRHHHGDYVLPWHRRYTIVKSLASAVLYLHEEWEEQVIHRNITSSAVLLDADMNPRLGCFALAEFLSRNEHGHHHMNSSARGIFGYMSPEYIETGEATTAADVYSFGVVVLEVVSGQMAVDFRSPEVLLVRRVQRSFEARRAIEDLVDHRLDGQFQHDELMRLVRLGVTCTCSDPDRRPSMKQIVSILDGNNELLNKFGVHDKKEEREDWEGKNALSLSLIRRIQAIGIQ
ncbi:Receptor like protein kinase S.2 [Ananas comosus]|uniref:Receptor like protein kinase S.2 n=1 Tax=Ananas comosus TaxID=4615 RepID=A0A199VE96_ANACO|nr:Receptor like protein kinase S.2 [Ananas comosus]